MDESFSYARKKSARHRQSYTEEGPDRPPLIYHENFRQVQHCS